MHFLSVYISLARTNNFVASLVENYRGTLFVVYMSYPCNAKSLDRILSCILSLPGLFSYYSAVALLAKESGARL